MFSALYCVSDNYKTRYMLKQYKMRFKHCMTIINIDKKHAAKFGLLHKMEDVNTKWRPFLFTCQIYNATRAHIAQF